MPAKIVSCTEGYVMDNEPPDNFIEEFRKQLGHVDEFVALVLNGHLEIEGHLDDNLKHFKQNYRPADYGFYRKVDFLRAYRTNPDQEAEWRVMLALNDLRNQIAHRGRQQKYVFPLGPLRAALAQHTSEIARVDA